MTSGGQSGELVKGWGVEGTPVICLVSQKWSQTVVVTWRNRDLNPSAADWWLGTVLELGQFCSAYVAYVFWKRHYKQLVPSVWCLVSGVCARDEKDLKQGNDNKPSWTQCAVVSFLKPTSQWWSTA